MSLSKSVPYFCSKCSSVPGHIAAKAAAGINTTATETKSNIITGTHEAAAAHPDHPHPDHPHHVHPLVTHGPHPLGELIQNNREWSEAVKDEEPNFFPELAKEQRPQYLWIGCSDSRVPANQIIGLGPGEVFVHRNIANVVSRTDLNCLSVVQFAIEVLRVPHIIVCGHTECGGVAAAYSEKRLGLVGYWLSNVVDVKMRYIDALEKIPAERRLRALSELNVVQQLSNLAGTHVVQDLWGGKSSNKGNLDLHGWCFNVGTGLIEPTLVLGRGTNVNKSVAAAVQEICKKYA
eukprot:PhM_4_TR10339/c0_g1_i1/m.36232/K01673/cynT, can; carbonic anhydrase